MRKRKMANEKGKRAEGIGKSANTAHQNGERRRGRGQFASIEWNDADADLLKRCIVAITRSGAAIQFGKTQAGDALTIRVVGDGEPYTEYRRPGEDIETWLKSFEIDYAL